MDISKIVDLSKVSTRKKYFTMCGDETPIVNDYFSETLSLFLSHYSISNFVKDEYIVDLGCGQGCYWIDKAVSESGGHYVGVDLQDLSSTPLTGEFIQADMFSFLSALKDNSVNFAVHSLDNYVLTQQSVPELVDLLHKKTKHFVYSGSNDIFRKPLAHSSEFFMYGSRYLALLGESLEIMQTVPSCASILFSKTKL